MQGKPADQRRLPAYLAAVAVEGGSPFGRPFLPRLAAAVRRYQ